MFVSACAMRVLGASFRRRVKQDVVERELPGRVREPGPGAYGISPRGGGGYGTPIRPSYPLQPGAGYPFAAPQGAAYPFAPSPGFGAPPTALYPLSPSGASYPLAPGASPYAALAPGPEPEQFIKSNR